MFIFYLSGFFVCFAYFVCSVIYSSMPYKTVLILALIIAIPAQPTGRLETITRKLTSPEFDGRAFKSEGGLKAAQFIAENFKQIGLKPVRSGNDAYLQKIAGGGQNVIASIEGRDPGLKKESVIICASYDAFGGKFAGAMDNAAGVALLFEIAREMVKSPPARSLIFIAFDGSEQGMAGAVFYSANPLVSLDVTAAAINLTGFGGGWSERKHDTINIVGSEFSPQLRSVLSDLKDPDKPTAILGADVFNRIEGEHLLPGLGRVPVLGMTSGFHYAYHSQADTADRINYPSLEKTSSSLTGIVRRIADNPGRIERTGEPVYDEDESMAWYSILLALRENLLKSPSNDAAQAKIDDALLELNRHKGRPVQDLAAREAVIRRAADICFFIANPNGVEYSNMLNNAKNLQDRGEKQKAIEAYRKLLKFVEEEYRLDTRRENEIRSRLKVLESK